MTMAGFTATRFPDLESQIKELAKRHLELEDEPLHLAMTYDPGRDQEDIFLFEIISNFGHDSIDPDKEIFETSFPSSPDFPMGNRRLHLVLTNPPEFQKALEQNWEAIGELRLAIQFENYEILYSDKLGDDLLKELRNAG